MEVVWLIKVIASNCIQISSLNLFPTQKHFVSYFKDSYLFYKHQSALVEGFCSVKCKDLGFVPCFIGLFFTHFDFGPQMKV
jgi:hypothetical protein